jgi:hypothetical protein
MEFAQLLGSMLTLEVSTSMLGISKNATQVARFLSHVLAKFNEIASCGFIRRFAIQLCSF